MEPFVDRLRQDYPKLAFMAAPRASWSAHTNQVAYTNEELPLAIWALLHELGHALLGHNSYESDASLLRKEVAAWSKAKQLAQKYELHIDDEHIEQCLDTYREWLYKRSTCPTCGQHGVQTEHLYNCLNCQDSWRVSRERFCRPYRLKKRSSNKIVQL